MQNQRLFALEIIFYNWVICLYLFCIHSLRWDKNLKNDTWFWTLKNTSSDVLLSTWITGATNTWPIITDRNTTPLLWFCRFLQFCGAITWTLFLSFGITDQLCSIYPPRPCNREATELRTAYPHHGNLTPPRISPSRFREYHYHPDCHGLHEKLSHGLWRDSRSSSSM